MVFTGVSGSGKSSLHADDVTKLMKPLDGLVESGNTVIVVEHDMRVVASSDYVIDIGPGAGEDGGRIVATGTPADVSRVKGSRTAPFLASFMRPHAACNDPDGAVQATVPPAV